MLESRNKAGIVDVNFSDVLSEQYLSYALSTIVSRSLPDVRDGLKPVHRRLLYAMYQLRLDPRSGFKKCARVVGDVIGKYHPHGDVAIYDAMVRMAQSFSVRWPLVDGQGNFGSIDGDSPAAMRYTEARLTVAARLLLEGLDEGTVDFVETYDGEDREPSVLPARFPNLLANGSTGIAVGMATSIPPHNIPELCDALLMVIKDPLVDMAALLNILPAPDFPTGGEIVESREDILKAYETGRGSFRVRASWHLEKFNRGQYNIVVTEIPWQVSKSRLIEKVATLMEAKKLPALADIRDESDESLRIVLEPKNRMINPTELMEHLYRQTDFEARIYLNMNVLTKEKVPGVLGLTAVLRLFLDHRRDVLQRSSRYHLARIENRLEILSGLLTAYLNLDDIIAIIRNEDNPKAIFVMRYSLSELQADSILNMRLRHLRKLEEVQIQKEYESLSLKRDDLRRLLSSELCQWEEISKDIREIRDIFSSDSVLGARRTKVGKPVEVMELSSELMVEKEAVTVVCSTKGWIRAIKGHQVSIDDVKFKEGDSVLFFLRLWTTDRLLLLSSFGRIYTLGCDLLPGGRGFGQALRLLVDLADGDNIVSMRSYNADVRYMLASDDGRGFITEGSKLLAQTRTGKQILNVSEGSRAFLCYPLSEGDDMVALVGTNRQLLIFSLDEIPVMGRGRGVILQRYKQGGHLSDLCTFKRENGLSWKLGERIRREEDISFWLGKRGQKGKLPPVGFPRGNQFNM